MGHSLLAMEFLGHRSATGQLALQQVLTDSVNKSTSLQRAAGSQLCALPQGVCRGD